MNDDKKQNEGILYNNPGINAVRLAYVEAVARAESAEASLARVVDALRTAEAALADIGDADREPEDDVAWCEARAAEALPKVRAALLPAKVEACADPAACDAQGCRNPLGRCEEAVPAIDVELPPTVDDLRAMGLSVAVHNDYRLNGQPHTFWLFTDASGMSYKGEGKTDAEALAQVRACMALRQPGAESEDTQLLNWFDSQRTAYGFEGVQEGNEWMMNGPFPTLRHALRECMESGRLQQNTEQTGTLEIRVTATTTPAIKPVVQEPLGYIIQDFVESRRMEFERNGTVLYAQSGGMATMPLYTAPQPIAAPVDVHADDIAVDAFATAMKAKMATQRAKGYDGWDNEKLCTDEFLAEELMRHTQKGDPVDVANFAMMLHQRHNGDTYIVGDVLKIATLDFAKRVASAFLPEQATAPLTDAQIDAKLDAVFLAANVAMYGIKKYRDAMRAAMRAAIGSAAPVAAPSVPEGGAA